MYTWDALVTGEPASASSRPTSTNSPTPVSPASAGATASNFAVLIRGRKADGFRKGERTREEITDLMAGGEAMADLEAELAQFQADA